MTSSVDDSSLLLNQDTNQFFCADEIWIQDL